MKKLILLAILFILTNFGIAKEPSEIVKLKYINFSPYTLPGQNPNYRTKIPETQIISLLDSLLPYTEGIRTFGCLDGLERIPYLAKQRNLKVILGIWLGSDTTINAQQIESGIKIAHDGMADRIIVGSEVLLRNDLTITQLTDYINQVKTACPGIPVSYADVYSEIIEHKTLIDIIDFISINCYPIWEGVSIDCAIKSFHQSYLSVHAIANGKEIFISESGWKTFGNPLGEAIPSMANAVRYLKELLQWQKATGIIVNIFSAFEEPWKLPNDGGWGLFNSNATLKPGMEEIFKPITSIDSTIWLCSKLENPGQDTLSVDYVPLTGIINKPVNGRVNMINPCNYRIAGNINVPDYGWISKPTFAIPSVPITCDGRFSFIFTTGGTDYLATDICLFLIPSDYNPPLVNRTLIPTEIYEKAITWTCIHRNTLKDAKLESSADTICLGQSVTLTAGGGTFYRYFTGDTIPQIIVKPTYGGLQTFSVEISDKNGNGQIVYKSVYVKDEYLSLEPSYKVICMGDSVIISLDQWASPAYQKFLWSSGQTTNKIKVAPEISTIYSLTASTGDGCEKTVKCNVDVYELTQLTISAQPDSLVEGGTSILTVSGGYGFKYLWSTGETTSSISVSPQKTTAYSVKVTGDFNCEETLCTTVKVPVPVSVMNPSMAKTEIFPNPAKDFLNVDMVGIQTETSGAILSMQGSVVFNFKFTGKTAINISHFEPGCYLLDLKNVNHNIRHRILIIK
jgi:exo-beta-1,3-glucanase (GH17 family)